MACGCSKPVSTDPTYEVRHDVERGPDGQLHVVHRLGETPGASLPPAPPVALLPPRTSPGRFVTEGVVQETLYGIAEADGVHVAACGACETTQGGPPTTLRVERATRTADGMAFETVQDFDLSKAHVHHMTPGPRRKVMACLPWVRVSRDPVNFTACLAKARALGPMTDPQKVYDLVREPMAKEDQEVFWVMLLDTQMHIRAIGELARGGRDSTNVPTADVLRFAIVEGALTMIVLHNHPSGRVDPSESDKMLTATLKKAGKEVGVPLLDHVIVGVDKFYSFEAHGLLRD